MEWGRGGKGKRKEEEKDGLKGEGNGERSVEGERWKRGEGGKGGRERGREEGERGNEKRVLTDKSFNRVFVVTSSVLVTVSSIS